MGKILYTDPDRTAILVLGAAVWSDGPSPTLRRRCKTAARVWGEGTARHVIVSGGTGPNPPSEADAIQALLEADGIPASAIFREDRATTTLENIRFSLPILERLDIEQVVIVTDATHAPRARLTAWSFGLAAESRSPSLKGVHKRTLAYQTVREVFALPAYAVRLLRLKRR